MEPISHFFYSHRLKLQFWDWGHEDSREDKGKPTVILVHGNLDHARNWDWVARALRNDYHVYAMDLRGHGNSEHAQGATYGLADHVLDLSALADVINDYPIYLIGHSLGGGVVLTYTGVFPERVKKVVAIEGLGLPPKHPIFAPASKRMRKWIEDIRNLEKREPRAYPNLDAAIRRMKEANPHLTDNIARHLTLNGTNWNSDGSLCWKFDNFARPLPPDMANMNDFEEIISHIPCPTLLFWGMESWAIDPDKDPRAAKIKNSQLVKVPNAGHWVHHDQLQIFLDETIKFLKD